MIKDLNKGLTISYNYLNLPETIEFEFPSTNKTAKILFVYDASGYKHRKIARAYTASTLTSETITDYVSGYEYVVSTTNGTFANVVNSLPSRIHHTEGALTKEANSNVFQYEYVLRDHLGNTRVTFKDKDNNGTIDYSNVDASINEVSQINHFYPYGLNMEGNWNGANGANKFTYNGKELNSDFGLDWMDYEARFYTADAPRWVNVDPLSEKMPRHSPYNYAFNNPIFFIDPNGMEPEPPGWFQTILEYLGLIPKQQEIFQPSQREASPQEYARRQAAFRNFKTTLDNVIENHPLRLIPGGSTVSDLYLDKSSKEVLKSAGFDIAGFFIPVKGGNLAPKVLKAEGGELLSGILKKVNNISSHLTEKDILGAIKDILGTPIKIGDKTFDHLGEVRDALKGLGNQISKLNKMIEGDMFSNEALKEAQRIRGALQNEKDRIQNILIKTEKAINGE